MRDWVFASAWLALCATASAEDFLPLNDGLFVTDPRLCAMGIERMQHAYGERIASSTRSIEGVTLSNNSGMSCITSGVVANGPDVTFTASCSNGGERRIIRGEYEVPNKDSFLLLGERFVRCGSRLAEDRNLPPTTELISRWDAADELCRGEADIETYLPECGKRDLLAELLQQRGWCYTQPDWARVDNMWHVCRTEFD